jgi:hypothetical protein
LVVIGPLDFDLSQDQVSDPMTQFRMSRHEKRSRGATSFVRRVADVASRIAHEAIEPTEQAPVSGYKTAKKRSTKARNRGRGGRTRRT